VDILEKIERVLDGKVIEEGSNLTKEQFNMIDWKYLDKAISKLLGSKISFIVNYNNGDVSVTTKNLADQAGVFSSAVKTLTIENWGRPSILSDEKLGNQLYLDLKYRYTHPSGGSNGTDLITVWWMFNDMRWVQRGNKSL